MANCHFCETADTSVMRLEVIRSQRSEDAGKGVTALAKVCNSLIYGDFTGPRGVLSI
jgi:hypothetical protein